MFHQRIRMTVFVVFLLWTVSGCLPPPTPISQATPIPEGVTIESISEENTTYPKITQTKVFDQCNSASGTRAEVKFSEGSSQETTQALVLKGGVKGEIGIGPAAKASIEGAVERHFASSSGQFQGHEESVAIDVQPHTKHQSVIVWQETRREGVITYIENGEKKEAEYSYRVGLEFVEKTGTDLDCSGSTAVQPTQPEATATTATEPAAPTIAPTAASSFTGMGYDFETGKQGWGVDTSNPIDATLSVTTEQHRSGAQALQLSTEIYGPNEQNNSYLYVDMTTNEPLNAEGSAPYDLTGYLVSCYVKFSEEFLASQGENGYVQMFVRDDNFGKSTGQAKGNNSVVNSGDWEKLTIRLGDVNNVNEGAFDPAKVYQFGVEFHPDSGSPTTGTGMIWVDDCQLEKP